MPSSGVAEDTCRQNKEYETGFSCEVFDDDNENFFDMSFDFDHDAPFDSSDASIGSNPFDEADICGSSSSSQVPADASVSSSTLRAPGSQQRQSQLPTQRPMLTFPAASNIDFSTVQSASVPVSTSQKLVHGLRPDGISISREDLLSLEGLRPAPPYSAASGKAEISPLTVSASDSEFQTPKTPRTPKERDSRINKAREALKTPTKRTMQPSNYYVDQAGSAVYHSRGSRLQRSQIEADCSERMEFILGRNLPISPPPSTKVEQFPHPRRLVVPHRPKRQILDSPSPSTVTERLVSPLSPTTLRDISAGGYMSHSYDQESTISPLTPWVEGTNGNLTYSPISPLPNASQYWGTDLSPAAQMQQHVSFSSEFDEPESPETEFQTFEEQPLLQCGPAGGLMIDFGDGGPYSALQSMYLVGPMNERLGMGVECGPHQCCLPGFNGQGVDHDDQCVCGMFISRSPTPSPVPNVNSTEKPRRRGGNSKKMNAPEATGSGVSRSRRRSSSKSRKQSQVSSQLSGSISSYAGKSPVNVDKAGDAEGGTAPPEEMFVNFTPSDSRKILTGVAPSGSSKTKARREKEAVERRRKLSEAAQRAVREAGGDWERVAGELVEV